MIAKLYMIRKIQSVMDKWTIKMGDDQKKKVIGYFHIFPTKHQTLSVF